MEKILKGGSITLLFLGYPLIIYALLRFNLGWLGAALILGTAAWKLRQHDDWGTWILGVLTLSLAVAYVFGPEVIAKLSPLLIHSGLLYLFWSSLKSTPLIEQFARLDFPEIPPHIQTYTRQLTMVWSGFFALNVLGVLWLAVWGDDALWALYNGLIVYLLVGGLILGEYLFRRIRFPDLELPSFKQSISNIVRNGHKVWGKERHGEG